MGCARALSSEDYDMQYAGNDSLDAAWNIAVTRIVAPRRKKGRAMQAQPLSSTGRAAGACAPIENRYSGLEMTAQAMRGGASLEAPEATACMTMAVPPLLNTEWPSVPSVTLGATTVAWAVPSAATISEKSGMSPAGRAACSA